DPALAGHEHRRRRSRLEDADVGGGDPLGGCDPVRARLAGLVGGGLDDVQHGARGDLAAGATGGSASDPGELGAVARPREGEGELPAGVVAEPRAAELRRPMRRDRLLEDVLGVLLVDLPVGPAADRDLVVLPDVDRADEGPALDHLGRRGRRGRLVARALAIVGFRAGVPGFRIAPGVLAGTRLLGPGEHVGHRAGHRDLAVDPGHELAAIEVRHLLAERRLLARLDVLAADPAARADLDPRPVTALAARGLGPGDARVDRDVANPLGVVARLEANTDGAAELERASAVGELGWCDRRWLGDDGDR